MGRKFIYIYQALLIVSVCVAVRMLCLLICSSAFLFVVWPVIAVKFIFLVALIGAQLYH